MATKYKKAKIRRVYLNDGSWYWVQPGTNKWIRLCRENEGETVMLERLAAVKRKLERPEGNGDMRHLVDQYVLAKEHEHRDKAWPWYGRKVGDAFRNANAADVEPSDVMRWIKTKYDGKLSMQSAMRAFLSTFFQWCIEEGKGGVKFNPCRDIKLKKPAARKTYIEHDHFLAIREAMMECSFPTRWGGDAKRALPDGAVMQCFVDLCYYTAQRSTEIRNLRWGDIDMKRGVIRFAPTKTLRTSGIAVDFKLTPEIRAVLTRMRKIDGETKRGDGEFVLHNTKGAQLTVIAARQAWERAIARVKLDSLNYTVKDIRAKALTDARHAGYSKQDLMVAAAHTSERMTEVYIKQKVVPTADIRLAAPVSSAAAEQE